MNRVEAMDVVAAARAGAVAITGPGANAGLLYERADAPATIYNMDMGYATAIALGMALAQPARTVISIEGDGSFFAGSPVLSTIWRMKPANLVVVVLDNGVWGTGDGTEPTATAFGTDFCRLALANGWDPGHVFRAEETEPLRDRLASALAGGGPHLVVARTDISQDLPSSNARPRPGRHLLDCAVLMRSSLVGDG